MTEDSRGCVDAYINRHRIRPHQNNKRSAVLPDKRTSKSQKKWNKNSVKNKNRIKNNISVQDKGDVPDKMDAALLSAVLAPIRLILSYTSVNWSMIFCKAPGSSPTTCCCSRRVFSFCMSDVRSTSASRTTDKTLCSDDFTYLCIIHD